MPNPTPSENNETQLQSELNFTKTKTDKLAVFIINVFGSIAFLLIFILFFAFWICWNTGIVPGLKPFDAFPFSTLEMSVSIFAIVLSISVLINQNRQSRIEKIRQQVEFEINVRAESEITKLLQMLHAIQLKLGLETAEDQELEKMKAQTDIQEIRQSVDEKQSEVDSPVSENL